MNETKTNETKETKETKPKTVARNKAFEVLKDYVVKQNNKEAIEALKTVKPSLFGISNRGFSGTSKHSTFGALFVKKGDTVNELDVFTKMHVGRKEANNLIKNIIKKSAPEEIKWISFDTVTGVYKLEKIGAEAPKDWSGYVPSDELDVDALL